MYLNEFCQVLVENKLSDQEKYFGRTKFMTPVIFGSDNCKNGDIVNIKITSFNKNNLFGFHKTNNNEKAA
jgi:tRNA-2-methylthio-N6-dimethylallyladenosine synthase